MLKSLWLVFLSGIVAAGLVTGAAGGTDASGTGKAAQDAVQETIPPIEGLLEEVIDPVYDAQTGALLSGTLLLSTQTHGQVEAHFTADTRLEGAQTLAVGDYLFVYYNGQMTRSLPGQINAQRVTAYRLSGAVQELTETGFLLHDAIQGDVLVRAEAALLEQVQVGREVTVYFNGVMTLSFPGQVNAAWIAFPEGA